MRDTDREFRGVFLATTSVVVISKGMTGRRESHGKTAVGGGADGISEYSPVQ